jgi:hypothetical protein
MGRSFEDRRQLVVTQLLGGLHHDDKRLDTRSRPCDHTANLAGLAHQRLGEGTDSTTLPAAGGSRLRVVRPAWLLLLDGALSGR